MTGWLRLLAVAAAALGLVVVYPAWKWRRRNKRRRHLLAAPLPEEYERIIKKNVPLYNHLPDALRRQLHGFVNVFLADKQFEGCGGLEITDQIRVTIAAQACILLLNRKTRYFSRLHTILVYPRTYVARTVSSAGPMTIEGRSVRLGESWRSGTVVLAWDGVIGGTSNITDACNVVLHEFAHQLDQEDGAADGAPILEQRSRYAAWAAVLSKEYEALRRKKARHQRSVLSKYGATSPAEFFAVATEAFFEKPRQMEKRHPELYDELKEYYKLDPERWL